MRLFLAVALIALFGAGCAGRTTITYSMPSPSMEPTIRCAKPTSGCTAAHSDRVVVRRTRQLERGDIVAFHIPAIASERCGATGIYIKRIVGLPGETVRERKGLIYIDGKELRERYVAPGRRDRLFSRAWHVPADSYFVLGDNRSVSCDSRVWGALPAKDVVGKVVEILHRRS